MWSVSSSRRAICRAGLSSIPADFCLNCSTARPASRAAAAWISAQVAH
jgi:hypothetical protein